MSLVQSGTALLKRLFSGMFLRNLSSAVIVQALLSAGNLAVGLILIRHAPDAQYGYYVLVLNALMLITGAQTQFIGPAMVQRITVLPKPERANFIGGLFNDQQRLLPILGFLAVIVAAALAFTHVLDVHELVLVGAAIAAALAAMYREFFRMVFLAYRLPTQVLRVDFLYVGMLVVGAALSTLTPYAANITVTVLFAAALTGGLLLSRALARVEPFNHSANGGILRELAPIGAWTVAGGMIHWTYSQGYNFLIVGTLDVKAVAAVAATRLLMMPINMLSTGVGSLMLPTASAWLQEYRPSVVFRRLLLICCGLSALALCYLSVIWFMRGFIFDDILHKQFENRDLLVTLWSVIFLLMIFRDQLLFLPLARARYRALTVLTMACAVLSLSVSYFSMLRMGTLGALVGVLTGETINVLGLVVMSFIEMRRDAPKTDTQTLVANAAVTDGELT
jgi:O-antigen/teichoic acid export membrane protein